MPAKVTAFNKHDLSMQGYHQLNNALTEMKYQETGVAAIVFTGASTDQRAKALTRTLSVR